MANYILTNTLKQAKNPLNDLLTSAISNAKHNFKIESESLYVKEIRVDQGYVLKRQMPVSRGSAHPINKTTSHVSIVLAPVEENKKIKNKK